MVEGEQQGRELLLDVGPGVDNVGPVIGQRRPGRLGRLKRLQVHGNVAGNEGVADDNLPALARLGLHDLPAITHADPQARAARQVEPVAHLGGQQLIGLDGELTGVRAIGLQRIR